MLQPYAGILSIIFSPHQSTISTPLLQSEQIIFENVLKRKNQTITLKQLVFRPFT